MAKRRSTVAGRRALAGARDEAVRALLDQGMPVGELRALVATADMELVRRILELHRERLAEGLAEQVRSCERIERSLIEAFAEPTNVERKAARAADARAGSRRRGAMAR